MTAIGNYAIGTRAIASQTNIIEPILTTSVESEEDFGVVNVTNIISTSAINSVEEFDAIKSITSISAIEVENVEIFDTINVASTIKITEIDSEESFDNVQVNNLITTNEINTSESFGIIAVNVTIIDANIENDTQFGTITIPNNQTLTNVGDISSDEIFGTVSVSQIVADNEQNEINSLRARFRKRKSSTGLLSDTSSFNEKIAIKVHLVEINLKPIECLESETLQEHFNNNANLKAKIHINHIGPSKITANVSYIIPHKKVS